MHCTAALLKRELHVIVQYNVSMCLDLQYSYKVLQVCCKLVLRDLNPAVVVS